MRTAIAIARWLAGIAGAVQIVLGVRFWIGIGRNLVPVHMLIGLVFVLALWTLSILAAIVGVGRGLVALALGWGLIIPVLGVTQTRLLPGSAHWVIQALHLLVGIAGMWMAAELATLSAERRVRERAVASTMTLEDRQYGTRPTPRMRRYAH